MSNRYNYLLSELLELFPEKCHLKVHNCFNVKVSESWGFQERENEDMHMIYVKGGRGFYFLRGQEEILEKGKLIFLTSGFPHSAGNLHGLPLPQIIPVRFGLYSNSDGKHISNQLHTPFCLKLENVSGHVFPELFEKLYRCFSMKESKFGQSRANILLQEILFEISKILNETSSRTDKRIERVKEFIINNSHERVTLEELAKRAELTPKYFTKLFLKETGTTPVDFVIRSRCKFAEYLLENTSIKVKEVADKLRYPDQYTFSKQFKKVMGYPPRRCHNR
ncbi:MAG: hypothetical protein A2020_06030 [Lentisphaerae bacterium GWF2_45_14]|nr:MAG: hypothetical protein A2020_06030 [Lentisphaerae bacterium GWF2_45_14]